MVAAVVKARAVARNGSKRSKGSEGERQEIWRPHVDNEAKRMVGMPGIFMILSLKWELRKNVENVKGV